MFTLDSKIEDVIADIPLVKDWVDILINNFSPDFDTSRIQVYYSYGFFVAKSKNNVESYQNSIDGILGMLYNDRLVYELSKVRTDVVLKMGNLIFSNRLPNNIIPSQINDMVSEITKVKMIFESDMYQTSDEVYNSIPELNKGTTIYSDEDIKNIINSGYSQEPDIDDILDKISKNGIDSLTKEEKDFLDRKSKDI